MRGLALRIGLWLGGLLAGSLPRPAAYALADLLGRTWHRLAPGRRALVAANLARVFGATGRTLSGADLRRAVRRAFVEHARYYLEMVRAPHYPESRLDEIVRVEDWERWEPILGQGLVLVTGHLGNYEPFVHVLAAHGLRAVVPVEEIEPRELYEFALAHRTSSPSVTVVPLGEAVRPMLRALRKGEIAALIADRDLAGDGQPVTLFGHPTTLPTGPAQLAVRTGRPLMVAACLRLGPERFLARLRLLETQRSGDRAADVAELTHAMARALETAIGRAPEQWFAAFQVIWADLPGEAA